LILPKVRIGRFAIDLPENRLVRIALGVTLVVAGGLFGFLPILGYWMVPLGLLVLASDSAPIRRFNRRAGVAIVGWWKGRKARTKRSAPVTPK
jgi:hypothetical protein